MADIDPAKTEYIVLRPAGKIGDSQMASIHDGEWRKRADLGEDNFVELDSPHGTVRAYPTDRIEHSAAGDLAQVYEVDAPLEDPGESPD